MADAKLQRLTAELEATKPKAAALDRLATAKETYCLRDAAKLLQMKEREFIARMRDKGWIARRGGRY